MTDPSQVVDSGRASEKQTEFKEFIVKRDKDGPFTFAGIQLAKASRKGSLLALSETLEAAVYKTRGGKFITSLSKTNQGGLQSMFASVEDSAGPDTSGYNKAAVHDTFEEAMAWFRPGRLTDDIRQQLGLDKPVRIE
jgi:hypothetical protein